MLKLSLEVEVTIVNHIKKKDIELNLNQDKVYLVKQETDIG